MQTFKLGQRNTMLFPTRIAKRRTSIIFLSFLIFLRPHNSWTTTEEIFSGFTYKLWFKTEMYGKRNTAQTQGSVLGLDQQTFPARIRTYRYATHRVPPKAIYWLDVRWKALRRHLVLWTENLKGFEKNKVTVVVKFDGGSRNATAFAIFFLCLQVSSETSRWHTEIALKHLPPNCLKTNNPFQSYPSVT